MNTYKAVLFDLDGTLLDTLDDLADSMNVVLKRLGFPTHPAASYKYFVGDGVASLAKRVLPKTHQPASNIERCSELMVKQYSIRWSNKTQLYPGIAELLTILQERKITLAILSNKPDGLTQKVVSHFLSPWPFVHIAGAKPDVPKKPDPFAALEIASLCSLSPSDFLYMGDTNTDMQTAVAASMMPVGVSWGFRTQEELRQSGAKILLDQPLDLLDHL